MSLRAVRWAAVLIGLAVLAAVTGCTGHPLAAPAPQPATSIGSPAAGEGATNPRMSPTSVSVTTVGTTVPPTGSQPLTTARPTSPIPPVPWQPPASAIRAAEHYASVALSFDWTNPAATTAALLPLSTPQWAAQLTSNADGGAGGQAGLIAGHDTAVARVLAAYPSAGPGPGQRIDLTATVTVTGDTPTIYPAAVAVDLLPQPSGDWLVGWSQ